MATMYKVTGHGAHATMNTPTGRVRQLFFKGQMLPADAPQVEIDHLLSVKLISPVEVGAPAPSTVEPGGEIGGDTGQPAGDGEGQGGTPPPDGTGTEPDGGSDAEQSTPDPDVEAKRAEAHAKLPADGSLPDGRAGQPVWVEFLVGKGYDYAALAKEDKPELVKLAKGLVSG